MKEPLECPKCQGLMDIGFILDRNYLEMLQTRWVRGKQESDFLTGVSIRDKTLVSIQTYRCLNCGYLESYARAKA